MGTRTPVWGWVENPGAPVVPSGTQTIPFHRDLPSLDSVLAHWYPSQ